MRKTYYATGEMAELLQNIIGELDVMEERMLEDFCDNNCVNEKGERCPFNTREDVCGLNDVNDKLTKMYNKIDKELTIREREEE